jgi:hypothetical protein
MASDVEPSFSDDAWGVSPPFVSSEAEGVSAEGGAAYEWLLFLLRMEAEDLPYEDVDILLDATLDDFTDTYPCLQALIAAGLSEKQQRQLDRAVAYVSAAELIGSPLYSDTFVTKMEIGGLAEWYKVPDAASLSAEWTGKGLLALSRVLKACDDNPFDLTGYEHVHFVHQTRGERGQDTLFGEMFKEREETW